MELMRPKYRIRCEFGVCKNFAELTVKHSRLGIGGALNICNDCAKELANLVTEFFKAEKKAEKKEIAEVETSVEKEEKTTSKKKKDQKN